MFYLSYDVDILAFLGLATVLATLKKMVAQTLATTATTHYEQIVKKNVNVNHQIYTEYYDN